MHLPRVPLATLLVSLVASPAVGQSLNGFDLANGSIPADEIFGGGPPRDGIPALTDPRFTSVDETGWLNDGDRLIAVEIDGQAKAYPLRIMNWHEIVNDHVRGVPIVVTYCPLCGTGMVFDPRVDGRQLEFGVSGLLYNSDVLMYDRETESLWSQIEREAVTGEMLGARLSLLPALHSTWGHWAAQNPQGLVLSLETGHARDYHRDPYLLYASSPRTMFPVNHRDDRLAAKEMVLGIELDGASVAFPLERLANRPKPIRATVGERDLLVYYFPATETAFATTGDGEMVPATLAFWFAWSAFHPETDLWERGSS